MILGYDLLAQRVVRYTYVYPFAEAVAGVLIISGALRRSLSPQTMVSKKVLTPNSENLGRHVDTSSITT